MQAQPKPPAPGATAGPTLNSPGADLFNTQPDGLWIYMKEGYADVIIIEVCGNIQNVNDKRSRYAPFGHGLVVRCPLPWLLENVTVQRGGQKPRWQASVTLATAPTADMMLPVRHLRVLIAIPNASFKSWRENNTPGPHEYYTQHSSLNSYTGPKFQQLLRGMSPASHWYP